MELGSLRLIHAFSVARVLHEPLDAVDGELARLRYLS